MNSYEMDADYMAGAEMYDPAVAAAGTGVASFLLVVYLVTIAIYYISFGLTWMKIGQKLNYDKNWMAWVPIANFFMMVELSGKPTWWVILFFIPVVNYVALVITHLEVAKKLGKPEWLGILAGLLPSFVLYLGLIPLYMLAYSEGNAVNTNTGPGPGANPGAGGMGQI